MTLIEPKVVLINLDRFVDRICDNTDPNLPTTGCNTIAIFQKPGDSVADQLLLWFSPLVNLMHQPKYNISGYQSLFIQLFLSCCKPTALQLSIQFLLNIFLLCHCKPFFLHKKKLTHTSTSSGGTLFSLVLTKIRLSFKATVSIISVLRGNCSFSYTPCPCGHKWQDVALLNSRGLRLNVFRTLKKLTQL